MKTSQIVKVLGAAVVAGALCGCGKKEEAPAARTETEQPVAEQVQGLAAQAQTEMDAAKRAAEAEAAKLKAQAEAEAAKLKAQAEAEAAKLKAQAEAAKAAAAAEVQEVADRFGAAIAQIEKLIAAKDYTVATELIQKTLAWPELTATQKSRLQGLLETVKKAMATNLGQEAKSTVTGALKGFGK